jgi:non-ribosomal peptide synthase protein (TIGR01720 family)
MFQCRVAADAVELDALLREAHERLDLERGRLLSALLIATPGQRQRLLLVIHHLAVDGVSWRVLLEDLELAYEQLGRSERVELPEAATSVGQWADELARHARGAARSELDHWRAQCSGPGAGTPQHEGGAAPDRVRDAQSVGFSLDERQTRQLLTAAPQLWQAEAQELLLTALARAFCRWAELPSLLVELEGHGREDLGQGLDLSRTVGWLTSAFPVLLTPRLAGDGDRERSIESVKAALRSTPRRGVGYGALRYLGDEAVRAELRRLGEPKVSFNYLGQFDQAIAGSRLFSALEAASGAGQNGDDPLPHSLAFSAHVYAGALRVRCVYGGRTQRREPLERLARELRFEIESLLAASAPSRGAERERGGRIEAKSAGSSHG